MSNSTRSTAAAADGIAIPEVNLATLVPGTSSFEQFVEALRHWGFFYLREHGIEPALVAAVQEQMRDFFQLPDADKQRLLRTESNPWGYYHQERTKNRVDAKEIFDVGPNAGAHQAQWPAQPTAFRDAIERWTAACHALCLRLLEALSQALNMPAQALRSDFDPEHSSFLRLNYYPLIDDPAAPDTPLLPERGRLGIHHHTDAGALTILLQDIVAGLQVAHEGAWLLIEPRSDALVVNIGDIAQVWSNDCYPAVLHRVISSVQTPRYSAAYFFNPGYAARYAPLPGMCSQSQLPRYREIEWGAFREGRAAGDYGDYGDEIQISDFAIPNGEQA